MSFIALILKPLAYIGLPAYLLHRLSQSSPLVRHHVYNLVYVCCLSFCSTVGFCAALPLSLIGRRYDVNYVVARTFYATFSRLSGIKIVVEDEEHLQMRPCVFICNHQTMIDVHILGRCAAGHLLLLQCSDHTVSLFPVRTRIMAKKSLKHVPIFGHFMQAAAAVFVDRGNSVSAIRSLQAAGEELKRCHTSIWVFPEGTRTSRPYHDIQPFKKGAFHLAIQAGLPIVPVVAENYWNIYHKDYFNPGTMRVRGVTAFLSLVCPAPLTITMTSASTYLIGRFNGSRCWRFCRPHSGADASNAARDI